MTEGVQSVVLALRVLEALSERGAMGVTEVARKLGTTKARVHRHLRTLVSAGYVVQDPMTEKYGVGLRLWLAGQSFAEHFDVLAAVRKVMRPLRDRLGHTVTASQVTDGAIVVLDMVRGTSAFEIGTKPGSRFDLHASAQGKVALAFGRAGLLDATLAVPLPAWTDRTITEPERLRREVAQVRAQGWAVAPGETLIGINALAAPVFDDMGALVGTIALVDSVQFLPPIPDAGKIAAIREAAARASRELGHVDAAQ